MKHTKLIIFSLLFISILCLKQEEDEPEIQDYEIEHIDLLRKRAGECTLFLKRNDEFPIEEPGTVLLIGNGARNTLKGGGGSGDVESRFFTTCEQGLEEAGFEIVSKDWFDEFEEFKKKKHKQFVEYVHRQAEKYVCTADHMSFGAVEPAPKYDIDLDYDDADIAIYVLSRYSSEGNDRTLAKGDISLTESEIRDIIKLDEEFDKFMLVLNTVGPVDLSPVKDVSNILVLSQLGVVTGNILADIILGEVNPSGKLSTTWASVAQSKFIEEFGKTDATRYVEGVYVGYRYFDSVGERPLFSFGHGLSYTKFEIETDSITNKKELVTIKVKVTNTGDYTGKEVVQVYVSPSQENKDKPYQSLVAFAKTKNLDPEDSQSLTLTFLLSDVARFDEQTAKYVLDHGKYIIRVGNSSDKTKVVAYIKLDKDIVVQELRHVGGEPDFGDFEPEVIVDDDLSEVEEIQMTENDFTTKKVDYNYNPQINKVVEGLKVEEAAKLCVCNWNGTSHLFGEAGETALNIDGIDKYIILADGPAGLRLVKKYGVDEKGYYRLSANPIEARLVDYFTPEQMAKLDHPDNNKNRTGKVHYQFTTAIPSATALAQSFNEELLELVGDLVGDEMDRFKVNLWLAPGMNIHRNVLCGRNFEYYSEDPYLSGRMAGAITRGVQKHKNRATTIKHFACNGQEHNRFNSDSILSERALREIYLRGFKIAIESSSPYALMTSYNLINGVHSSERFDLLISVIRDEWKYEGLIMSDWFKSGTRPIGVAHKASQSAARNVNNGNNLQMGGGKDDYNLIIDAYKEGYIRKETILECASKVYEIIEALNK